MPEQPPRTYPHGVPSWVDTEQPDPQAAAAFYGALLGWSFTDAVPADHAARAGCGDHLAATSDPGIRERQASAPVDFADVIGSVVPVPPGEPARWRVTVTVADRDDAAATAERLGATVLASHDGTWARTADLRDPQGALLTLSQFTPPGG